MSELRSCEMWKFLVLGKESVKFFSMHISALLCYADQVVCVSCGEGTRNIGESLYSLEPSNNFALFALATALVFVWELV